jgi:hypothetical protein
MSNATASESTDAGPAKGIDMMDDIISSVRDELDAAEQIDREPVAQSPTRSPSPTARWGRTVPKRSSNRVEPAELAGMRGVDVYNQSDLETRIAEQIDEKIALQVREKYMARRG